VHYREDGGTCADKALSQDDGRDRSRLTVVIRDTTGGLVGVVAMSCPMDIDLLSK
jgi:hypothetical protein